MAFCMNCGTKLPDGAKFCFSCGAGTSLPNIPNTEEPKNVVSYQEETHSPTPFVNQTLNNEVYDDDEEDDEEVLVDESEVYEDDLDEPSEDTMDEDDEDDEEEYDDEYDAVSHSINNDDDFDDDEEDDDTPKATDNPAYDDYWDDVLPEVEAEIYRLPKDIILKGVGCVVALFIIMAWFIYML